MIHQHYSSDLLVDPDLLIEHPCSKFFFFQKIFRKKFFFSENF